MAQPCPECGGDCLEHLAAELRIGVVDDLESREPLVVVTLFDEGGEVMAALGLTLERARACAAAILDAVRASEMITGMETKGVN